jgi:hypothetical protein
MATTFITTRDGKPYGTWTETDTGWVWDGPDHGPLIINRTMNSYRRSRHLSLLGLLPEASRAAELTRSWGVKATDNIEMVPVPGDEPTLYVPISGHNGAVAVGTIVQLDPSGATLEDGTSAGRTPRSLPVWFTQLGIAGPVTGVIAGCTEAAAVLKITRPIQ